MKKKQHALWFNLIECARECYVKTYNLAIKGDFCCSREELNKLDAKVFSVYAAQKNPKKIFRTLLYVSGLIYNNEIIVDSNLCYDLNILLLINKRRLYKPHKFIQFVDKREYVNCIVPGVRFADLDIMINKLLRGVKDANNS